MDDHHSIFSMMINDFRIKIAMMLNIQSVSESLNCPSFYFEPLKTLFVYACRDELDLPFSLNSIF